MGMVIRFAIAETIAIVSLIWLTRTLARARWSGRPWWGGALFLILAASSGALAAIVANAAGKPDWLFAVADAPLMLITVIATIMAATRLADERKSAQTDSA